MKRLFVEYWRWIAVTAIVTLATVSVNVNVEKVIPKVEAASVSADCSGNLALARAYADQVYETCCARYPGICASQCKMDGIDAFYSRLGEINDETGLHCTGNWLD